MVYTTTYLMSVFFFLIGSITDSSVHFVYVYHADRMKNRMGADELTTPVLGKMLLVINNTFFICLFPTVDIIL